MELIDLLKREDIPEDVKDVIRQESEKISQYKEQLNEAELRYRDLVDNALEIIFIANIDGIITSINSTAEKLTGWSQDEWIERPFSPKIHPDDLEVALTGFREVIKGENPPSVEIRIKIKNGNYSTFEIKASQIIRNGQVTGILGFARNIDIRKQTELALRESEEKYRILVENANDGITIIQDGIVKFVNQALAGLAGLTVEEVIGTPFMNFIHPDALPEIVVRYERRMAGQDVPSIYETTLITNHGEPKEVEINAELIKYEGKPADLVIVRDITERKETEKALAESEAKSRAILNAVPDIIFQLSASGEFLSYKGSSDQLYVSPKEFLGKTIFDVLPPKLAQETMRNIEKTLESGIPQQFEYHLPIKEAIRNFEARLVQLRAKEVIVLIRDISEQKKILKDLRDSEERYRTLVTTMTEGVWVTDLENKTIFVNNALERMLGYKQEELINNKVNDFLSPNSLPLFEEQCKKRYINGIPTATYELKFYRKDRSPLIARVAGTGLYDEKQRIVGSFGLLSDITAEKKAQDALKASEERYRTLVELSPDAIILTDLELNIIAVNQQAVKLNGANNANELIGCNTMQFIYPEDRENALKHIKLINEDKRVLKFEYMLLREDGTSSPAEMSVSQIYNNKNQPEAFIAIIRDISERKKAEQALKDSEEKYRSLVENINCGVFRVSAKGEFLQYNRALREMYEYSSDEEFRNISIAELYLNPVERNRFIEELYQNGELYVKEVRMKKKDGTPFWVSISSRISADKSYHDGILEDITNKKLAEEGLKQVKLEEERYHAMLSHFVNNDLQKIISNLELLSLEYDINQSMNRKIISNITEIANRSSKTIDLVSKIFEVLQSPFDIDAYKYKIKFDTIIDEVLADFVSYHRPFNINQKNLDFSVIDDKYIHEIFREIIFFLLELNGKHIGLDSPISIDSLQYASQICITIRDFISSPIEKEICTKLSGKITDKWEYQGHFIGITLASVIMQHYGGQLKIYPSAEKGNEFQLWFPLGLFQIPSKK